ncbi:MAG: hypothetical protein JWO68_2383 [Actinomycetia bacterium]|nr:hypothetical protein [Actinomycetes bacterium]
MKKRHLSRAAAAGLVFGLASIIGIAAYAFTASNTVPTTNVGAGTGTVSGYTVSNVHYVLNSTTPTNVDSLTFTVSPVIPSTGTGTVTVSAALSVGGPNIYTCTRNTTGDLVTCTTTSPQLTADKLNTLTVVAAQ